MAERLAAGNDGVALLASACGDDAKALGDRPTDTTEAVDEPTKAIADALKTEVDALVVITRVGTGVIGTATAIVLGVAFLSATLVLGDTLDASFGTVFRTANAGTDVITFTDDEVYETGDSLVVSSSGTPPAGLSAGGLYYAIKQGDNKNYKLATSRANALAGTANGPDGKKVPAALIAAWTSCSSSCTRAPRSMSSRSASRPSRE